VGSRVLHYEADDKFPFRYLDQKQQNFIYAMGHFCRICGRTKPNEKFSGKGYKNHICKLCAKRPKAEQNEIRHSEEIFGFLMQSNISKKNLKRLNELSQSENKEIAKLASLVHEVGRVKSHKRRRLKFLAEKHKELLNQLEETGLIDDFDYLPDYDAGPRIDEVDFYDE
jgi:hypothetical protein